MSQHAVSAPVALTRSRAGEDTAVVVSRELTIALSVFAYYLAVDLLPRSGRGAAADAVGRWLLRVEQVLHIDIEGPLNRWLAGHDVLSVLANYEYAFTYVISAFGLLGWVMVRRPGLFRRVRASFVWVNLIGITCFLMVPTTPPRLLPGSDYVDTVSRGNTWGSWGSGLVDGANQLAAMPSLHLAWAAWVSAVLAMLTASRWVQVASGVHVLVTFLVIVATANHYVLDAVAAFVVVGVAERVASRSEGRRTLGPVVPPHDAFFLHVEDGGAPQTVGGAVIYTAGTAATPSLDEVRRTVAGELGELPRFRQRLGSTGRWRRRRWEEAPPIDWEWHVPEVRVAGRDGYHRLVAELAETPLPRDRPLWRVVLVRGLEQDRSAFLFLLHHSVADGLGTVIQAMQLMRPHSPLARSLPGHGPGPLARAAATATGLAQLATDGSAHGRFGAGGPARDYATAPLDLEQVRRTATGLGVRVTDLVVALAATGVARTRPDAATVTGGRLRVAVSLMVRAPGKGAEGNATAAVMLDVPCDGRPLVDLLPEVTRRAARLRRPTRAVASRFVMATGLRVLPEPAAAWFARTVYGRRFFHGVVSNMPGPALQLTMAGVLLDEVYPILPLAPGTPFALGALSWNGVLGLGVATDPDVVDARELVVAMVDALGEL